MFDKTWNLLEFKTKLGLLVICSCQYRQAFKGRNLKDKIVDGNLVAITVNRIKIAERRFLLCVKPEPETLSRFKTSSLFNDLDRTVSELRADVFNLVH